MEQFGLWIADASQWLADTILAFGYPGIFLLMAVESSFIPFPSEIIMIPAGYQIAQGNMHWAPALAAGVAGSLAGALVNYALALKLGRAFFLRYGKCVFVPPGKLEKAERFFQNHGETATFVGRLLPVVRQIISVPAGIARMNLTKFSLYTAAGAGIWVAILTYIGYLVGDNQELVGRYLGYAGYGLAVFCAAVVAIHIWRHKRR